MPPPDNDYMNYTLLIEDDEIEQWVYTPYHPEFYPNANEAEALLNQQLANAEMQVGGIESREVLNESYIGGLS